MSTTRRTLLGAGAALALPVWMARAFASSSAREDPELEPALERARAVGKPLEDHGRLEATFGTDPIVRLVDLDRFAALVRYNSLTDRQQLLARAARQRLFELDPRGARWKNRSSWCPTCGMGMVPPVSRYFLELYTR